MGMSREEIPLSASPVGNSWEAQVVAGRLEGFPGTALEPNLEHAYGYFHEFVLTGK